MQTVMIIKLLQQNKQITTLPKSSAHLIPKIVVKLPTEKTLFLHLFQMVRSVSIQAARNFKKMRAKYCGH